MNFGDFILNVNVYVVCNYIDLSWDNAMPLIGVIQHGTCRNGP